MPNSQFPNKQLLLDNTENIWLVKSGCWAVFAINVEHGIPKGRRRYLFSVKASEVMFCANSILPKNGYQILAVALEESELLQLSPTEFCESTALDEIARVQI